MERLRAFPCTTTAFVGRFSVLGGARIENPKASEVLQLVMNLVQDWTDST